MTWLDSILMIIVWILLIVANEYLAAEWIGKISLSSTEGELCVSVLCQSAFHMNGSCNLQKQHQRYIFFIGPHRRGGPLNLSGPYTVKQIVQQSDAQRCVAQVTEPFTKKTGRQLKNIAQLAHTQHNALRKRSRCAKYFKHFWNFSNVCAKHQTLPYTVKQLRNSLCCAICLTVYGFLSDSYKFLIGILYKWHFGKDKIS